MLDTNDVFNNAVRGSTLHSDDNSESNKSLMGSKIVSVLLLTGIAYVGFNYYSANMTNEALVVKKQIVAEIQTKAELIASVDVKPSNSEMAYLNALKSIEGELTEERETVNLDTKSQMSLSTAMNNLTDDTKIADNTTYANELRKEIGSKSEESSSLVANNSVNEKARAVIIKKGDTLQGLSDKFYGDPMNYKRIIASNDSLHFDDTIYEGQTILLPY